ncbi:MAG: transposase [Elusimicrobiota bacterium]|nr:transposase [Elusimicrobiota bacterium]
MSYSPRIYLKDYWYHVYSRGQRGEPLFFSPEDRIEYLKNIDSELVRKGGFIGSFCLMTNHMHLLIKMGRTPLGEIFRNVNSKYARNFNRRRKVFGHVLQKRPGIKIVLDNKYLHILVGYIHRNPVKSGISKQVTGYRWSSWYWFKGQQCNWIELKSWAYPPGFENENKYVKFKDTVKQEKQKLTEGKSYIGNLEEWNNFYKRRVKSADKIYKERRGIMPLEKIAEDFTAGTQYSVENIKSRSRKRELSRLRHSIMNRMWQEGHKQTVIAQFFNRDPRIVRKAIEKHSNQ